MASPYASAARGVEAGFGMALRADEAAEAKRARKVQEDRLVAQDAQSAETHALRTRALKTDFERNEEDRAVKGVGDRLKEIERQAAAAQSAGGAVDPALAREHGELTDVMTSRARRSRGVLERLSPQAQTGGEAPNPAVGAAGATDTDLGVVAQKARDFWSRMATGEVDLLTTTGPDLRMHLAAATGVKIDELPEVVQGTRDVITGMQTANQGLVISGMNKAMLGRLRVGIGAESPYGGTITRKEIIGLDPAIDANGQPHPNRFFVRLRVYVQGVSPTGDEMYYDAPMTKDGSTAEKDIPVAIDIKRGFDWAGNMQMLSEIVKRPDLASKLGESDGGKSDAYIDAVRDKARVDNLTALTRPKAEYQVVPYGASVVDKRTGGVVREGVKTPTAVDEARAKEIEARTERIKSEIAGTLPARPKAGGKGGGGGGGGGSAAPTGLPGLTKANAHLVGEELLATLDPATAASVRGIASGEIDPKGFSSRSNRRGELEALARLYAEGYSSKTYPTAAAAEKAFATGVEGRKVRSFNVAIDHMETLRKLADALNNGDIQRVNAIANLISKETGRAPVTNFEAARDLVADEIVAGVVPGMGALADRKAAADKIRDVKSPAQFAGVLLTYQKLLGGQLQGLEQQYVSGGGAKDFRQSFLLPRSREVVVELGLPPQTQRAAPRVMGGAPSPAPAAAGGTYSDAEKERRYQAWKAQQAGR